MRSFKPFWNAHKWTGLCVALLLVTTSVTGFGLLLKKRVGWIQPPTFVGAAGGVDDFISNQRLFEVVFGLDHPDFTTLDDIDRVDFRPGERVFKVRSRHNYAEIQVCAVTGDVLNLAWRPSDLLESIHDGSFWAGWFHDWVMPVYSGALLFMVGSGLWLWIEPKLYRRRRLRRQAER